MKLRDAIFLTVGTTWAEAREVEARAARAFRCADLVGNVELADLTTARVHALADDLAAAGLAQTTVSGYMSVLRTVLRTARDRGHLSELPSFPKRAGDRRRKRWLRPYESDALLGAVEDPEVRAFLRFLLLTGMRFQEARGLDWGAFEETANGWAAHLRETKSGEPRLVPLSRECVELMRAQTRRHPDAEGPFLHLSESRIRREWKRAKASAGLADDADLVIHTLRHTCATRLLDSGLDLTTVSRLLGHASIATTGVYVHQTDAANARLAEALDRL